MKKKVTIRFQSKIFLFKTIDVIKIENTKIKDDTNYIILNKYIDVNLIAIKPI